MSPQALSNSSGRHLPTLGKPVMAATRFISAWRVPRWLFMPRAKAALPLDLRNQVAPSIAMKTSDLDWPY